MNKDTDKALTYRELWGFVNVLYMTLRQLHDEHSPVNSAMAPDPFVISKVYFLRIGMATVCPA